MSREVRRAEAQFERLEQMQAEIERQRAMINHVALVAQSVSITPSHVAPLPSPLTLTEYQNHPEFYRAMLDRFTQETAMVKAEQDHRHDLDRFNFRITAWGVGLAWTLMFLCFGAAVGFVIAGLPVAGLLSVIVAMTALAGNLIHIRNKPAQTQSPAEEKAEPENDVASVEKP